MSIAGRTGLTLTAVAALGGAFVAGTLVAGGTTTPGSRPTGTPSAAPIQLANADLRAPGSCEELLDSYVRRGGDRVGPYGWDFPIYYAQDGALGGEMGPDSRVPLPAAEPEGVVADSSRVVEQGSSETGTNVQETGVDEPDVVKSDGSVLVRVQDGDLVVYDVTGSEPVEVSDTDLRMDGEDVELLLAGDRVVVVSSAPVGAVETDRQTRVTTYDISDPAAPAVVDDRSFDTDLVRAVQHGDTVRLVLVSGLPDLDFVRPRFWRDDEEALATNKQVVADSTIGDWLPTVTTYDAEGDRAGSEQLLDCSQVTVPSAEQAALGTVSVVGFDVDDPSGTDALGVATDTRLAYVSADRLYLATSSSVAWSCCVDGPVMGPQPSIEDLGRSRIYAFELTGSDAEYVASGVVDGVIADRWSLDEHDGVLRVAVGPSQETGDFNSVLTLRQDGDDLEVIGRVDRLGVGEQIESVRWFDDLAVVVTFRQVDPLYAVDLSDPQRPRLLGHLKIPGFSEYLHPISGQRLIGIGQDASRQGVLRGAQAALFDVSDLTDPRQTDVVRYREGSVAAAAMDPRQFTWLPDREVALTVVSEGWQGRTGWVSVLTVSGGSLSNRMVPAAYGSDVDAVRLLPLPDGRVVLVTGDDVSFFEV